MRRTCKPDLNCLQFVILCCNHLFKSKSNRKINSLVEESRSIWQCVPQTGVIGCERHLLGHVSLSHHSRVSADTC